MKTRRVSIIMSELDDEIKKGIAESNKVAEEMAKLIEKYVNSPDKDKRKIILLEIKKITEELLEDD